MTGFALRDDMKRSRKGMESLSDSYEVICDYVCDKTKPRNVTVVQFPRHQRLMVHHYLGRQDET